MRRIKMMAAVLMLAAMASVSAQTAFAGVILNDNHKDGVLLSDDHKDGVLLSDDHKEGVLLSDKSETKAGSEAWDILVVVVNSLTGVYLSD